MAYSDKIRETYQSQLKGIQEAGLFKQERFIHSPQAADIEVEFPAGSPLKKVINMCANNYLGLSSHPDVVQAAHEGSRPAATACRRSASSAAPRTSTASSSSA
jgi:7-keto-8-aminopelargonate synthetase-like enzyme